MIDLTPKRQHYSLEPTRLPRQPNPPLPYSIGLPAKYTEFREGQWEFIDAILSSKKRFIGLQLPTGTGKSIIYSGTGLLAGGRSAYLTATKTLSDQLKKDMAYMADIRGLANYPCVALITGEFEHLANPAYPWTMTCDDGPC